MKILLLISPLLLFALLILDFISGNPPPAVLTIILVMYIVIFVIPGLIFINHKKEPLLATHSANKIFMVGLLLYAGIFIVIQVMLYNSYNILMCKDTVIYAQTLWNTLHPGRFMYNSVVGTSHFSSHIQPILFLILPIYALFKSSLLLIILKNVLIIFSVIPIYLIARKKICNLGALFAAATYLFMPVINNTFYYGFKPILLAPFFLNYLLYFSITKKAPQYYLFLALTLICREDMPLFTIVLGILIIFQNKEFKRGGLTVCVSVAVICLYLLVIKPAYKFQSPIESQLQHSSQFLKTDYKLSDMATTNKIHTFGLYLLPMGIILPFLSGAFLPALPHLLGMIVMNDPISILSSDHYYLLAPAGVLFISVIIALGRFKPRKALSILYILMTLSLFLSIRGTMYMGLRGISRSYFTDLDRSLINGAISSIPEDSSVIGPRYILAHIPNQRIVLPLEFTTSLDDINYIIIDETTRHATTRNAARRPLFNDLKKNHDFLLSYDNSGLKIFRRSNVNE